MTLKQFIAENNGATFKRTVTRGATIEDIDAMRAELETIAKNNDATLTEDETTFRLEEYSNVWLKPRVEREKVATLHIRSNATEFDGVRGELPKAGELLANGRGFTKDYRHIAYKYERVEA